MSKSNTCPICGIQFYKKESQLNRLVKESISYVSDIIRLTSLTITNNEITDTNSLPDISLVIEEEEENKSIKPMLPPPPPPPPPQPTKKLKKIQSESQFSQLTDKKPATKRATNKTASSKNRSQSVTIDLTKMTESQNNSATTTINSITARSSQSVKRIKKNNKGETAIHLCVMNNDLISLKDLLENDSTLDVNIKDNAGWTALHEVSYMNIIIISIFAKLHYF